MFYCFGDRRGNVSTVQFARNSTKMVELTCYPVPGRRTPHAIKEIQIEMALPSVNMGRQMKTPLTSGLGSSVFRLQQRERFSGVSPDCQSISNITVKTLPSSPGNLPSIFYFPIPLSFLFLFDNNLWNSMSSRMPLGTRSPPSLPLLHNRPQSPIYRCTKIHLNRMSSFQDYFLHRY